MEVLTSMNLREDYGAIFILTIRRKYRIWDCFIIAEFRILRFY